MDRKVVDSNSISDPFKVMFILKLNLMVFYFLALLNEPAIFIRMSTSYIVFNYYWVELFLFNVLLLSLLGLIMFFTAQSSKKINSVEKKYVLKNINILLNYIFIVVLVYLILQLLFVLVNNSIISQVCLSGFLVVNSLIYFAKVLICFIFLSMYLFLFSYIQSCWLSLEFLLLLGFLLLLSLFILSANDLFFLYLLVEGLTFIIILLMASYQKSLINLESAIKYFILGAVSSSLLVFSVFWFFLILHLTNITELGIFFSLLEVNFFYQEAYYFFMTPTLLLIVAFFIKLGAFPFNI